MAGPLITSLGPMDHVGPVADGKGPFKKGSRKTTAYHPWEISHRDTILLVVEKKSKEFYFGHPHLALNHSLVTLPKKKKSAYHLLGTDFVPGAGMKSLQSNRGMCIECFIHV
jgi:hypothetical protein